MGETVIGGTSAVYPGGGAAYERPFGSGDKALPVAEAFLDRLVNTKHHIILDGPELPRRAPIHRHSHQAHHCPEGGVDQQ